MNLEVILLGEMHLIDIVLHLEMLRRMNPKELSHCFTRPPAEPKTFSRSHPDGIISRQIGHKENTIARIHFDGAPTIGLQNAEQPMHIRFLTKNAKTGVSWTLPFHAPTFFVFTWRK